MYITIKNVFFFHQSFKRKQLGCNEQIARFIAGGNLVDLLKCTLIPGI